MQSYFCPQIKLSSCCFHRPQHKETQKAHRLICALIYWVHACPGAPKGIGLRLDFKKWGVISLSSSLAQFTKLHPLLFVSCDTDCMTGEHRASPTSLERSLLFLIIATARLRARQKDLKNQLPGIITFSEEPLGSNMWVSAESPPLCSPPPLHLSTLIPTDSTHTQRHLRLRYTLFIPCFVSVSSVCTCRAVTCRDCQSWTMPPSVIWGRGLGCSASRLEAEDKEERVRGRSPELITVTVCCGSEKTF